MFCACELIPLFTLIHFLIITVYIFDVRLVINWTNYRRRPVEGNRRSTGRLTLMKRGRPTCYLHKLRSEMWKATHTAKVKFFLVSREQYMSSDNSYIIILPLQISFFKHRSLEYVLSSPDAPLQQAFTYAAVGSVLRVYKDRKQWKFAFNKCWYWRKC